MREHGFDDDPRFRAGHAHRRDLAGLPDHPRRPDAPRRAHRRRGDRLPGRADAASSGRTPTPRSSWYTYRPTYPLSYLLGRTLLLGLRADEQRRLGDRLQPARASTTRCCATARCRSASIAGCMTDRRPDPRVQVIPAIDLEAGRSRIVYWPGAGAGIGAPTDRPDRIAERFVAMGARLIHLVDFDGARAGAPANLEAVGAIAARIAVPLQLAGGVESADAIRLAFAAGATRVVPDDGDRGPTRTTCAPAWRSRATGWRSGSTRGRSGWPPSRGAGRRRRPSTASSASSSGAGVAPVRPEPWRRRAGPAAHPRSRSVVRCRDPRRRRGPRSRRAPPPARHRRRRRHPR